MCSHCEVAKRVINGDYGNGAEREARVRADGECYICIQNIVNCLLGNEFRYPNSAHYGFHSNDYCDFARAAIWQ